MLMRSMSLYESLDSTGEVSLKEFINTTKMKEPSFLMVLIGVGDYAYRRQDGVYVVPIGCLRD